MTYLLLFLLSVLGCLPINTSASNKMSIGIAGLDKVELLYQLWSGMKPASFFANTSSVAPGFDREGAEKAVTRYIDYFAGRCINTDLSGARANTAMYDRNAGAGTFVKIVNKLRDARSEMHDSDLDISDNDDEN